MAQRKQPDPKQEEQAREHGRSDREGTAAMAPEGADDELEEAEEDDEEFDDEDVAEDPDEDDDVEIELEAESIVLDPDDSDEEAFEEDDTGSPAQADQRPAGDSGSRGQQPGRTGERQERQQSEPVHERQQSRRGTTPGGRRSRG